MRCLSLGVGGALVCFVGPTQSVTYVFALRLDVDVSGDLYPVHFGFTTLIVALKSSMSHRFWHVQARLFRGAPAGRTHLVCEVDSPAPVIRQFHKFHTLLALEYCTRLDGLLIHPLSRRARQEGVDVAPSRCRMAAPGLSLSRNF
jgi:hypothetical protein